MVPESIDSPQPTQQAALDRSTAGQDTPHVGLMVQDFFAVKLKRVSATKPVHCRSAVNLEGILKTPNGASARGSKKTWRNALYMELRLRLIRGGPEISKRVLNSLNDLLSWFSS